MANTDQTIENLTAQIQSLQNELKEVKRCQCSSESTNLQENKSSDC